MVALHAERVSGDARAVRWVVPAGLLPAGRVRTAPGRLGELLADGTLCDALIEHTAVWLWVREPQSWGKSGGKLGRDVQAALRDALGDPGGWVVDPAPGEVLERVTADVLEGPVGDFVRSHGGSASCCRIDESAVAVALGGACEHCPAAGFTLRQRLVNALRERCPDLAEVDSSPHGQLTLTLATPAG